MAHQNHITSSPFRNGFSYVTNLIIPETGEYGLGKIVVSGFIFWITIHGKYIYESAILQSQFIKGLTRYAANLFYTAGGGEEAEGEEEEFVFQVTGCRLLVIYLTLQQSFIIKSLFSSP